MNDNQNSPDDLVYYELALSHIQKEHWSQCRGSRVGYDASGRANFATSIAHEKGKIVIKARTSIVGRDRCSIIITFRGETVLWGDLISVSVLPKLIEHRLADLISHLGAIRPSSHVA